MDDVDLSKIENLDSAIALDDSFVDWPTEKINPEIQKKLRNLLRNKNCSFKK